VPGLLHATRKRGHGPRWCGRRPPRTYRWHDHPHAAGRLGRSLVSAAGWPARHILPADYALRVDGEFVLNFRKAAGC